jgi:hypothetical protein
MSLLSTLEFVDSGHMPADRCACGYPSISCNIAIQARSSRLTIRQYEATMRESGTEESIQKSEDTRDLVLNGSEEHDVYHSAQHEWPTFLIASGSPHSTDLQLGTLGNVTFRFPTLRAKQAYWQASFLKYHLHIPTPISRSARQSSSSTCYTTSALVPIAGLYVRGTMRHDMGLNVRKGRSCGYLPSWP